MHQSNKTKAFGLIAAFVLIVAIVACASDEVRDFVPAPPPTNARNVVNIQQLKVGENAQLMSIVSPHINVIYRENGDGAGQTATEIVELTGYDCKGTMLEVVWGDWEKAELKINEYYGCYQNLVRGMVTLSFADASIFQFFRGHGDYVVNRSYLVLLYETQTVEGWPTLAEVSYTEIWGVRGASQLLGATAVWDQNLENLLSDFTQWGFWEVNVAPADVVAQALTIIAKNKLAGAIPTYEAIDTDSPRELIGRQTGFHLKRNGREVGTIKMEYGTTLGRQPNTPLIGKGALSLVEWRFEGQYYALVMLTPEFSPVGSTLYLFLDDQVEAEKIAKANPVELYAKLRANLIPHVFLSVYAMGDIGSISSRVIGGEGGSVDIGDEGGVQFRSLGSSSFEDVRLASNLLAMLGKNGLKALGFYYAYDSGSGSGLCYYLTALQLILAEATEVMNTPWIDVGILDTVGVPNLGAPPFTN